MVHIDMVTVLMASALVSMTLAVAFLILGKGGIRSRALTVWGLAHGCWGAGILLLLTRGVLPELASVLIPNGLLVLGQGLAWCAAKVHKEEPAPFLLLFCILLVFLAIFTWFTLGDPNISARIVIVRLVIAFFALATILSLWPEAGDENRSGRSLAALSFLPHALLMLLTAAMGVLNWDPSASFMAHPVVVVSVALGLITHLLWGVGVLVMVFQRMAEERASADMVFKALVEQSLAGIYEIRDGVVTYANPEMTRMFGYEASEVIGVSTLAMLIAPEDRERVARMFEEREQGITDVARYTFTGLRRTGERFQVEVQGTVVRRDSDATVVMGVALDVTDRIAAEQALITARDTLEQRVARRTQELEEEARDHVEVKRHLQAFAIAFEQSPHMVLFTDQEGRVEYANPRFLSVRKVSERKILGRNIVSLIPGEHALTVASAIREIRSWSGDLPVGPQGRDGWVNVTLTPIHDSEGGCRRFVVIQTDITAQKDTERDLARARDMAELASRAKSELLANMSDELRTPLNAIIGFSDAMGEQLFGPLGHDRYGDYVQDINRAAQHLLNLINDILDVAALEAGRLTLCEEDVALADVVDSALRLVSDRARQAGLIPRVDLGDAKDRLIRVDARRIKQVLLNLLTNAIKFTPEGGSVSLTCRFQPDGALILAVSDTGMGMSKEEISIALSRFGQVDISLSGRHEGTGLGLPLAQDLALIHGATLDVESEPGMGTTVSFTLPSYRILDDDQTSDGKGALGHDEMRSDRPNFIAKNLT
ncbi:PAS domain S-box protein [Rhodospirillum sp. A1_3_36]|uniref:sensor histidine kinase n=1 Tax=Rhodospirillum sp. A1_3_36 TaxID=3391666 RepID=UPI0039A675AF